MDALLFAGAALLSMGRTRKILKSKSRRLADKWEKEDYKNEFLKEVQGEDALKWVREKNAQSKQKLGDPEKSKFYDLFFSILNNKDQIPNVYKIHNSYYNFWQDESHPRGIWRRTSLADFKNEEPNWELVLDLDALNKAENESWVWQNVDYSEFLDERGNDSTRVLIFLSPGGTDARVVREFDLESKQFITGVNSFTIMKPAKTRIVWKTNDVVLLGTDLEDGDSLTDSGYPLSVREWKRGTPALTTVTGTEASKLKERTTEVFRGEKTDVSVVGCVYDHRDYKVEAFARMITFYTHSYVVKLPNSDKFVPLEVPKDADIGQFANFLLVVTKSSWTVNGVLYEPGTLLSVDFEDFLRNNVRAKSFIALFTPTPTCSLNTFAKTRNYLIIEVLDNVKSRLIFWKYSEKTQESNSSDWEEFGSEEFAVVRGLRFIAVCEKDSDMIWYTTSSFVKPQTLSLGDARQGAVGLSNSVVYKVRSTNFDTKGYVETQGEAISKDGTKIPYFLIHKQGLVLDSTNPTLLYGYGGFEISLSPGYMPLVVAGWLECGGVFVYANIRGGGEFGPSWHQAALKQNRNKAYEDFEAIAENLIAKKITSPKHLGIRGASNGGLLMGNMMVRRPELFGAIVCQVPLIDMRCFNKLLAGASWMAEYGDPDTEDWTNFLYQYSAYHNIDPDLAATDYPAFLMISSTKDDRVHPYHARSFVKRLTDLKDTEVTRRGSADGVPDNIFYYENIEGGHGGAADYKQQAYVNSLYIEFLWQTIGRK